MMNLYTNEIFCIRAKVGHSHSYVKTWTHGNIDDFFIYVTCQLLDVLS